MRFLKLGAGFATCNEILLAAWKAFSVDPLLYAHILKILNRNVIVSRCACKVKDAHRFPRMFLHRVAEESRSINL